MQAMRLKQPRRYRWLRLSVFLFVYTVFHAVLSAPSEPEQSQNPPEILITKSNKNKDPFAAKVKEELLKPGVDKVTVEEVIVTGEKKEKNGEKEEITIKEVTVKEEVDKGKDEKNKVEKGTAKNSNEKTENVETEENKGKEKDNGEKGGKNKMKNFAKLNTTVSTWLDEDSEPTLRAKRNCTPPAIEQFPRPLMGPYGRRHGGLIIHILVAIFTFVGLAIVCDEYFVSSLDRICEELKMAPDVAGATFMAAGSSAPELATVIIGVFWAQDDIGVSGVIGSAVFNIMLVMSVCALCVCSGVSGLIGSAMFNIMIVMSVCALCVCSGVSGVIGSAVFNIMFVISVCALCAGTVSHLNWWPLCRDCFFYAISILVMLCTIWDGLVSRGEALFMLLMYVVYCVALHFNTPLERWSAGLKLPFKLPSREEQAALVTYKSAGGEKVAQAEEGQYATVAGTTQETPLQGPNMGYSADGAYENVAYNAEPAASWNPEQEWDPNRSWSDDTANQAPVWDPNSTWNSGAAQPPAPAPVAPSAQRDDSSGAAPPAGQQLTIQPGSGATQNYYRPKEHDPATAINPLDKPANANPWQLVCWAVAYPVHWSARHTMPDCRGRWYPLTFVVSMLWISFYSYFMVWMITIIGSTLNIPDTVMGLTFVAAGVSVPDALSSLAVIKEGYGDMAVSNAVGSNVFDILVCLGLPWFIQTAIIKPGSSVNVISKGLVYSTLSLFSTVVFLVVATHANGWKLDRKYGIILMVWYLFFITLASLYELNVFGNFHPPDCGSYF